MNANELKVLLDIIDSRVTKKLSETKFLKKYTGRVVQVIDNSRSVVKLAGEEEGFIFANKSGKILNVGDNVHIETIGTDLNTGVISEKFGFDEATNTSLIKSETVEVIVGSNGSVAKTNKWGNFNFIDNLNFCWRKVPVEGTPINGVITFTETLPFKFIEEPFVLSQPIVGSDNFSQPISYSFITEKVLDVDKYTKIEGKIFLKDTSKTNYSIDLFIIGKI